MVCWMKRQFAFIWNAILFKLHLQSFLITVLIETCPQFLMNLMNSPYHIINMFFVC